jgi:hypothetical protein
VFGAGSASAGKAAAAAPAGGSWGGGVEAVLPANAATAASVNQGAGVGSISCPSAGNCSAVGGYTDSSGLGEGLLLTETAGTWGAGGETVLPANADTTPSALNQGASVGPVSCASAGNCTAVGTYVDAMGNQEGMLLTETAGSWSAGVEAVLPSNATSSRQLVQWGSVSCSSAGHCAAVGSYTTGPGAFQGLLLTETDGSWSTGVDATATYSQAWLNAVSCPSNGNCTAVGAATGAQLGPTQGIVVTETAGSWGPAAEAVLPADNQNLGDGAELYSVSCAAVGSCTAVGAYDVSDVEFGKDCCSELRGQGLLLTETAGNWATGVEATMPSGADGPSSARSLPAVSCPSAGNCSVAGSYYDTTQSVQGVLLAEAEGSWTTGIETTPPNPPSNGTPSSADFPSAISCASPGNCGAISGTKLLTQTAGSWTSGAEPSLPANAKPGSRSLLSSTSCATATDCSAVGWYLNSSGHPAGLLVGGSPASVTLHISKNGTGSGAVSSRPTGIHCGPSCSALFDAGTSLTLTATPSPGSRFSGWSGGGCSGTRSCRPNTGISKQTVTATFRLLPKCVVPKLEGKPLKPAEHAIRTHNCSVGKIAYAISHTIEKGRVISQKPNQGRRLKHGAKISLVISKGTR